jgi:hypothetical protein
VVHACHTIALACEHKSCSHGMATRLGNACPSPGVSPLRPLTHGAGQYGVCAAVKFELASGFTPLQLKTLRDQIFAFKSLKKNDLTLELFLVACGACARRHACLISHAPTLTDRTATRLASCHTPCRWACRGLGDAHARWQ